MVQVNSDDGLVTANDQRAADAGATMLAAGGNAIDAIVATAFALAVTEPWLGGIGGGAWIVGHHGGTGERFVVEGPLSAPGGARADTFPLEDSEGSVGMYGWPRVVGDANVVGARSIAIPGAVAALCAAHERWGRLDRATIMEPAVRLAADGHEIDWLASALITAHAAELRRFDSSAALLLRGGLPPAPPVMGPGQRLVQPALARTLEQVAAGGEAAFYRGPIGRAIADSVAAAGGVLSRDDMARCVARSSVPAHACVGEADLYGPLHTGFPTMVGVLQLVRQLRAREAAGETATWARAIARAFEDRFSLMSTDPDRATPWDELMSAQRAAQLASQPLSEPADRALAGSGCTSHMTAVDRDGTVVSLTQTVLGLFGSHYVEPETGALLNNGMMYFDPRPGRVTSIRPGLPGLAAVSPTIVERAGVPVGAVGASGGRRIITAVARVVDRLLAGSPIDEALAAPRMHVEGGKAWIDPRWGPVAADELAACGLEPAVAAELPTTFNYARANGVARVDGNRWSGSADDSKPVGVADGGGSPR